MKLAIALAALLCITVSIGEQHEYTVHFDSVEIVSFNKDYIENPEVIMFSLPDGTQAFNGSGTLKQDLGKDIKVNATILKQHANNEYKKMTSLDNVELCDILDNNAFGVQDILKHGNLTICPWKAVNLEASKLQANNEYKVMTTVSDLDMCDLLDRNALGMRDFLKYGNVTLCPWKAENYVCNNAVMDFTKLPPLIPVGKYIVDTHLVLTGGMELAHFRSYQSILLKQS